MSDTLQDTLDELLRSGSTTNPALNRLLDDYMRYHLALVAVGSLFMLGFAGLSISSWTRFRKVPAADQKWTFEKRTYFSFAALGASLSALLAVVVAANISNVLEPRTGFAGTLSMIGAAAPGTQTATLHHAFTTWLQSGSGETPPLVQQSIDDRLAWQQPKAIICSVLFVVFAWLSTRLWRTLIAKSRPREPQRNFKTLGLRAARWSSMTACLLLMLMVMGNTQASFAPLGLTLLFG